MIVYLSVHRSPITACNIAMLHFDSLCQATTSLFLTRMGLQELEISLVFQCAAWTLGFDFIEIRQGR